MNSLLDHKHTLLLEHAGLSDARGSSADGNIAGGNNAELVMALLHTASRIDRACAAQLAAFELTEGRLSVLLVTARHPGATPAFIADSLGVTRAAVTSLLDGLERQAYIMRRSSASDRRSSSIELTQSGSAALERIAPLYGDWLTALSRGIAPTDARATLAALDALHRNLDALDAEGAR
ncbi:MarR family winged helix-turn-helix transcriptional regulator [Leucobacter aridicollis]|uniref:DNA-binding MarR family transcriptional regulator n=1 Tax=Leucobacter aridicollis TaxID=283878 RepID=A0A852R0F0_9MICO|nr:MarR family transcriptional regulator [Leucobacter aridicollis]MBL3681877.1 MarR family transcriptional regulator [Leucobacter aridicollis]NYD27081.1 DNA-binding MarR family transcriptional regulator [Leucobacter aridicollis]